MKNFTTVNFKEGSKLKSLTIDEYIKWLALIEAIDLIKDRDPNVTDYKLNAIRNYIDDRFSDLKEELLFRYNNNDPEIVLNITLS